MQPKEIKLQKKRNNSFSLSDKQNIAEISQTLKDIEKKYPVFMDFIEFYCGFTSPLLSTDPHEICYSQGKRDVVLMIKTLMRDDILPDEIAKFYKNI